MAVTNPLMARFAGEPALVAEQASERFQALLTQAVEHPHFAEAMAYHADSSDDFWSADPGTWRASLRPYVVQDGVLQIPVKGVLLHDFPYALGDYATGYEYIWRAFQRGCGDYVTGAIKGIALVENSPGGMVAGCFDAVDKMVALKEQVGVPVRAFAHESAYSAAYGIATVADHIAVSRTGGVGSIGVVTSHTDASGAYEKMGLKITFIASDPSKVEGNSTGGLSEDAKARIQARIDELYSIFEAAVLRSRPVTADDLRNTLKAYCFTASQATSNGLADSIGSLEDATSAFADFLDDQSDNEGEEGMSTPDKSAVDQAVEAAVAAEQARAATAQTEAVAAAIAADRARQKAITGHAEAAGRETLASHIALNTTMSVEDAAAMLAASPKTTAAGANEGEQRSFDAAMSEGAPNVGAGGGGDQRDDTAKADDASGIVALAARFGLKGFVAPATK